MQDYVVVNVIPVDSDPNRILVVRKDRPEHQKGRINLPGGKIEPGETPIEAAIRELKEETGLDPIEEVVENKVEVMGCISGHWGRVYCVNIYVYHKEPQPREGETEYFYWTNFSSICCDPMILPNLKVIIPLCKFKVKGWEIIDNEESLPGENHLTEVLIGGCK